MSDRLSHTTATGRGVGTNPPRSPVPTERLSQEQRAYALRRAEGWARGSEPPLHTQEFTTWLLARALLDAHKEITALREDARRLDWLESSRIGWGEIGYNVALEKWLVAGHSAPTLREAIDAAFSEGTTDGR